MRGINLSDFKQKVIRTENAALSPYKYFIDPALKEANKIIKERGTEIDKPTQVEDLELDNEDQK